MLRRSSWLFVAVLVLPAAAGAASLVNQSVQSDFDPDANIAHPKQHTMEMILAQDFDDGATVCVSYSHTRSQRPNGGRVRVLVEVVRPGGPIQRSLVAEVDFGKMKLDDGRTVECLDTEARLREGDHVVFNFTFQRRPQIREAFGEAFGVRGSVRQVAQ